MTRPIILTFSLIALLATAACVRKDLLVENLDVEVSMTVEDELPLLGHMDAGSTYRALVYSADKKSLDGYGFMTRRGGSATAHAGHRAIVVHTFGCEASYIDMERSLSEAMVTTNRADAAAQQAWAEALAIAPAANTGEDSLTTAMRHAALRTMAVSWEPDAMWVAAIGPLDVPHREEGEAYSVTATAKPAFMPIRIIITDVEGMQWITGAEAFVVGASPGRLLFSGEAAAGSTVLRVPLYRAAQSLVGQFCCFGFDAATNIRLLVAIRDTGRGRSLWEYDITEDARSGDAVIPVPSGMRIDEPDEPAGGGFLPVLEDWYTRVVPVQL